MNITFVYGSDFSCSTVEKIRIRNINLFDSLFATISYTYIRIPFCRYTILLVHILFSFMSVGAVLSNIEAVNINNKNKT